MLFVSRPPGLSACRGTSDVDLASLGAACLQALLTSVQQTGPTRSTRRLSLASAS